MRSFVWGFIAAFVVIAIAGYAAVYTGAVPARADSPPPALEKRFAQQSLDATVSREAPQPPYPFPSAAPDIIAGAQLYLRHCSVCHGTGSSQYSTIAQGLYVKPPQFAKHGVDDDPAGVTYWKIEHGIRWTGMPAYGGNLTEKEIWQMAYFLATAPDKLPPEAATVWQQPFPANMPTLPPGVPTPAPIQHSHAGAPDSTVSPTDNPSAMASPSDAASPAASASANPGGSGSTTTT